ncbi:MAG: DUF1700 domain-containing protein [Lachnospiraceae bacterium]|nr:DUF1700 domain-containing protein [Lachnospiraceae bacterium]
MEKALNDYLEKIEKHLKPIAVSERVDIIKEIKSEMQELQSNGATTEQIIDRLGNPKDLARAYLGDLLSKKSGLSWNRFLTVCAFYSLVGFSGLFVIPCLGIIAPSFIICGIITPILGIIKLVDYLLHWNLPFVEYIGFQFGTKEINPVPAFFLSVFTGIILLLIGRAAWKLLVFYCKKVSKTKNDLSI